MRSLVKHILLLGGLSTFSLAATAQAEHTNLNRDQITVQGVGELEHEPDKATLMIKVEAQEPTLLKAKTQADKQYESVLKVIKKSGVENRHIKAARISAQPQYDWSNGKSVYSGEKVSRSIRITILDLEKVSSLMQGLVENGVSTVDGLTTGFQDEAALQNKALEIAADNAKEKAQFLANRLDRTLGAAFRINESNSASSHIEHAQMTGRSFAKASRAAPQEMFGTKKIRATVSVSFGLK